MRGKLKGTEKMAGVGLGVTAAMIATQFLEVGLNTLIKEANTNGMSNFVFIVYSNFLALFVLLPSTFFYHRCAVYLVHLKNVNFLLMYVILLYTSWDWYFILGSRKITGRELLLQSQDQLSLKYLQLAASGMNMISTKFT